MVQSLIRSPLSMPPLNVDLKSQSESGGNLNPLKSFTKQMTNQETNLNSTSNHSFDGLAPCPYFTYP